MPASVCFRRRWLEEAVVGQSAFRLRTARSKSGRCWNSSIFRSIRPSNRGAGQKRKKQNQPRRPPPANPARSGTWPSSGPTRTSRLATCRTKRRLPRWATSRGKRQGGRVSIRRRLAAEFEKCPCAYSGNERTVIDGPFGRRRNWSPDIAPCNSHRKPTPSNGRKRFVQVDAPGRYREQSNVKYGRSSSLKISERTSSNCSDRVPQPPDSHGNVVRYRRLNCPRSAMSTRLLPSTSK